MAPDIEIAKLKKTIPYREELELIIKELLKEGELVNSTLINLPNEKFVGLNQFKDIHSILINDIPVSMLYFYESDNKYSVFYVFRINSMSLKLIFIIMNSRRNWKENQKYSKVTTTSK